MTRQVISFEPGEEKLARAFEQIELLWKSIWAFKARADMDSIAMLALLNSGGSVERALQIWQQESTEWIAQEAAEQRDKPEFEWAARQLKIRADFWDEKIERLAWPVANRTH